jgi:ATP-dependent phosphofructokinase / diphosphate-dependent phosphofructokinase
MRIGMLNGGGDCPGLNAVIRAVVRKGVGQYGHTIVGYRHGWRGLIEGEFRELPLDAVRGLLPRGGTILGTSRTNPYKSDDGPRKVLATLTRDRIDALIAVGGEDTLGVAARLHAEHGAPTIGVPKTIDNDLPGTDQTFGFDTAVSIATEAIDRLHTTAESHNRVMVVEVMGRHAGWLAVESGLAGGADVVLIPEFPLTVERCAEIVRNRHRLGKDYSIVVVSEGWPLTHEAGAGEIATQSGERDAFGHVRLGGVGQALAHTLEEMTGFETRVTILGHLQRGGTPTAYDRVLATRFGLLAADLADRGEHGKMVALRGQDVVAVPIAEALAGLRTVPRAYYALAEAFFG